MNTTTTTAEVPEVYVGWVRRGTRARWRLFCRALSEQRCLEILLGQGPPGTDKLVRLESDGDPNLSGRIPR